MSTLALLVNEMFIARVQQKALMTCSFPRNDSSRTFTISIYYAVTRNKQPHPSPTWSIEYHRSTEKREIQHNMDTETSLTTVLERQSAESPKDRT